MPEIRADKDYAKFHGQRKATLIAVTPIDINHEKHRALITYDTGESGEACHDGPHVLLFLGERGIPFTALRRDGGDYEALIGKTFDIVIDTPKSKYERMR